jgi:hypothetical protein
MPSAATAATDPIVIVGAGRSGTTRLNAVLGAHPDVFMIGETSFLLPRLWAAFQERPDYSRPKAGLARLARETRPEWRRIPWWKFWYQEIGRDLSRLGPVACDVEAAESARLERAFGDFFAEVMIPPALRKRRWGFKEIWAGGDSFPYDWTIYRAAFPAARYVQSIRHPFAYVTSMISNMHAPDPSEDEVVYALEQWVRMVAHARELRDTGRYLEYRMEDFDGELPRVMTALELDLHPDCVEAARGHYLPSVRRQIEIPARAVERATGLRPLAAELGYDLD